MKFVFWIAALQLLVGCSRVELGYKLAPRIIVNRLDDAFDFNSDRFNQVRLQIESDFKKNKKEATSAAIKNIDQILAFSEKKDLTISDFKENLQSLQNTEKYLITLLKPTFEELLKNLSKEEFNNLTSYTKDKFEKADKLLATKDDFLEKQMDGFETMMDFFFDSSTKEQKELYKQFLAQHYDYFLYQIEVRKNFLKNFEAKLNTKPELLDYTLKYYSGDPTIRTPEHQAKQIAFLESACQIQFQIWNTITEKQKVHFRKTLNSLKDELFSLLK